MSNHRILNKVKDYCDSVGIKYQLTSEGLKLNILFKGTSNNLGVFFISIFVII